jgi:hypothetical protein
MTAFITLDSRAVRWAAPEKASGPLGGREPYPAEGSGQ